MRHQDKQSYIQGFIESDRYGALLGGKFVSLSEQECIFEYEVNPAHFNPNGVLHGGTLFGIMDTSQGMYVHYILDPQFKAAATGTATVKYLAPVRSGKITIRTFLKEQQGRKIFVNSTATDASGQQVAVLEEIWIAFNPKDA